LADFSGSLAADERDDGSFGVLSAVDPRRQRRLRYEVLDRVPTRADVLRFLARLNDPIRVRGRAVVGMTTDASPLSPRPVARVLPGTAHQVCAFPVQKALTQAVLRVRARLRKRRAAPAPARARGRPQGTKAAPARRDPAQAIRRRVAERFEHRPRFVRRHRDAGERAVLGRRARPDRPLRALRAIRDEVSRRFDRRCRPETALAKLARLRPRVRRYRSLGESLDKLNAPHLEQARPFLDDTLLPATSNAVERGNRRHRPMPKAVYRVRTLPARVGRLALDLERDHQGDGRSAPINCLHEGHAKP
jgi:hypothetical protein